MDKLSKLNNVLTDTLMLKTSMLCNLEYHCFQGRGAALFVAAHRMRRHDVVSDISMRQPRKLFAFITLKKTFKG